MLKSLISWHLDKVHCMVSGYMEHQLMETSWYIRTYICFLQCDALAYDSYIQYIITKWHWYANSMRRSPHVSTRTIHTVRTRTCVDRDIRTYTSVRMYVHTHCINIHVELKPNFMYRSHKHDISAAYKLTLPTQCMCPSSTEQMQLLVHSRLLLGGLFQEPLDVLPDKVHPQQLLH